MATMVENMSKEADEYYSGKGYSLTVIDGCDALTVEKPAGSDWSYLKMEINGRRGGDITLRSKEMAEQLHAMLGSMLGKT